MLGDRRQIATRNHRDFTAVTHLVSDRIDNKDYEVGTRHCRVLIQIRGQKNLVSFNNLSLFTDIQRRNPVS